MKMKWKGPYKISQVLDCCLNGSVQEIPEEKSVYLISRKGWENEPTRNCKPLYVGSNTGRSKRFRTRVGDLIADMFGFYIERETGHHSGGQTLNKWCKEQKLNPKNLYISWLQDCACPSCTEMEIFDKFNGLLENKKKPPRCKEHPSKRNV